MVLQSPPGAVMYWYISKGAGFACYLEASYGSPLFLPFSGLVPHEEVAPGQIPLAFGSQPAGEPDPSPSFSLGPVLLA
jgi:hypothetical protein